MKWSRVLSYFCLFFICAGGIYYFFIYKPFIDKISKDINKAQVLEKTEKTWETQLKHAQMLSYLRQYVKAELKYRMLLNSKPNSNIVKVELAKILYYQGMYEEALNFLNQIPEAQKDEKVKLLIADIDIGLERYAEAEFLYLKYLQQYPKDQNVQLKLAKVLTLQKKYEQSIELYQKLLAHSPQNVQIRRQYALVLIWMGRYDEGEEELNKTLGSEKNIP